MGGTLIANNPDGLPYHFDFKADALEVFPEDWPQDAIDNAVASMYGWDYFNNNPDVVVVKLIPDDNNEPSLYFICFNDHNGYYYHDFSFCENREKEGGEE